MPFAYYHELSSRDKATYRKSDRIVRVPLNAPEAVKPVVTKVHTALTSADRRSVQLAAQELATAMVTDLGAPPVHIKVLDARPSHDWGELQGLYEPNEDRNVALITVWMRTAAKKKVVAFKTFLRTVLHELCHHLDYELFDLEESFHTEGFFKRESSLYHQIATNDVAPEPKAR